VGDIAGRFRQAIENTPPWLRRVYPENPHVELEADAIDALLDSLGYEAGYLSQGKEKVQPKIHLKANFFASPSGWRKLMVRPELGPIVRGHLEYLASQVKPEADPASAPDVRAYPENLRQGWLDLIRGISQDLTPADREQLVYYFTVGSTNMDYRSMVMDGEVMVVLGGWQALLGFMDFLLLPGLCEWVETTEQLDALLPPPGGFTRGLAGLMKLSL
jgi:hypothetical protein